jgi:hypothetical protein
MWRNSPPIVGEGMSKVINELEEADYYSVLFPIASTNADYLPQISASIKNNQKIKYMIPIRPYLLSPQYLAMLSSGIERIASGRTIFNFIHGHLYETENLDGIIFSSTDFSSSDNRRSHLEKFISTLKNIKMYDEADFSDFVVSGGSQEILKITERLGGDLATTYSNYLTNYKARYSNFNFKKVYAQVSILPRETEKEAELVRLSLGFWEDSTNVLCGSYDFIAKKIEEIEALGVTDLLIGNAFDGGKEERQRVHDFSKYFKAKHPEIINLNIDTKRGES